MESVGDRRAMAEKVRGHLDGTGPEVAHYFDLEQRERTILYERFRLGYPLSKVAGNYNISRERVRQIEARALSKLASWQT